MSKKNNEKDIIDELYDDIFYLDKERSPALDEEMSEGLTTMAMVMECKCAFPYYFHFLKGNHEKRNFSRRFGGKSLRPLLPPFKAFAYKSSPHADGGSFVSGSRVWNGTDFCLSKSGAHTLGRTKAFPR